MTHSLVCDFESTGTQPLQSYIISGCMILLDNDRKEVDRMKFTMRPRYWDSKADEAVKIHGITREQALGFPTPAIVLPAIYKFIKDIPEQAHFVCHANRSAVVFGCFGRQILQSAFLDGFLAGDDVNHFIIDEKLPVSMVISTHTIAKNAVKLDNYKLSTVCHYLGIPLNHHNAESDCEAAAEIYRRLYNGETLQICQREIYGWGFDTQSENQERVITRKPRRLKSLHDFAY